MKGKIKKFWTEHEDEIKAGAACVALAVGGGLIGYCVSQLTICNKVFVTNDRIAGVLMDAQSGIKKTDHVFTGITDEPFFAKDLGKLGEKITELGGAETGFTHFIAIEKSK